MKYKLYTWCETCSGLFDNRTNHESHRTTCDGSVEKSAAEIFAVNRSLYLGLLRLQPEFGDTVEEELLAELIDLFKQWRVRQCQIGPSKRRRSATPKIPCNGRSLEETNDSNKISKLTVDETDDKAKSDAFVEDSKDNFSNNAFSEIKNLGTVVCKNGIVRSARLARKRNVPQKQAITSREEISCDDDSESTMDNDKAKVLDIRVDISKISRAGNDVGNNVVDHDIEASNHTEDNDMENRHISAEANDGTNSSSYTEGENICKNLIEKPANLSSTRNRNSARSSRNKNIHTIRRNFKLSVNTKRKICKSLRKNLDKDDERPPGVGVKRSSGKYVGKKVEYDRYHEKWSELYIKYRVGEEREGVSEYACDRCEFRSTKLGFFDRHMRSHFNPQVTFMCEICSYKCDSIGKLNKHAQQHVKPYMCEFCSLRFSDKQALERHTWIHTKSFPFSCPDCDYRSRCRRVLEDHRRKHTGEILRCNVVGCNFTSCYKAALTRHVVVQHEAKAYKCDQCDFIHTDRYKYQRHIRQHSEGGAVVYTCQSCSYTTPTKKNLTRHALVHATDKIYYCDQCPYSSIYSQSLRVHMMGHYDCKPWLCSEGDFRAVTRAKVHQHIRTKHNDLSNVKAVKQNITLEFRSREFARDPTEVILNSAVDQSQPPTFPDQLIVSGSDRLIESGSVG